MKATTTDALNARIDSAARAMQALRSEVGDNRTKTLKAQRAIFYKLDQLSEAVNHLKGETAALAVAVDELHAL